MMDQRLSSGPRMPDSLNGEGALRKALDGPIDGRARKTSNTGDDGNTSSSQSLAIEGCNQVLLSLIEVRKQQGVLPLKFFGFAHSRIIPSPSSFVTLNFLRALSLPARVHHDEDGVVWADVPTLPGCVAGGAELDEVLANPEARKYYFGEDMKL